MTKSFRALLFFFVFSISIVAFLTPVQAQTNLTGCKQVCPVGQICTCDTDLPCGDTPRGALIAAGTCENGNIIEPKDGQTTAVSCSASGCGDQDGCLCRSGCKNAGQTIPFGTSGTCGGAEGTPDLPEAKPQPFEGAGGPGGADDTSTPTGTNTGSPGIDLSNYFMLNPNQTVASVYDSPGVLINRLVTYTFVLAGMLLFFFMLYGGFLFITGETKGKDKAAEIMTQAVIGFVVMFVAYWIMQIISVVTGTDILVRMG